jgi:hypothetical protein
MADPQQLQMELHVMALKVENLTRENCELRARNGRSSSSALSSSSSSSAPTAGDKALRRDYELVTAEKDRLMKLIEQLKHEKKQLVETVLHLSNEVDAAHKSVASWPRTACGTCKRTR